MHALFGPKRLVQIGPCQDVTRPVSAAPALGSRFDVCHLEPLPSSPLEQTRPHRSSVTTPRDGRHKHVSALTSLINNGHLRTVAIPDRGRNSWANTTPVPAIPKQRTASSSLRSLLPHLMGYEGWPSSRTATCSAQRNNAVLWRCATNSFSSVHAGARPRSDGNRAKSFLEVQSAYPTIKDWSSADVAATAARCTALTPPTRENRQRPGNMHRCHCGRRKNHENRCAAPAPGTHLVAVQPGRKLGERNLGQPSQSVPLLGGLGSARDRHGRSTGGRMGSEARARRHALGTEAECRQRRGSGLS